MADDRFLTTSQRTYGTVPKPDPPAPIGSRKELTKTSWKMGDSRSYESTAPMYSTAGFLAPQHGPPALQTRTKKELTGTNWKGGDPNTQTWTCTNTLPE
jgi:hypothetical protein